MTSDKISGQSDSRADRASAFSLVATAILVSVVGVAGFVWWQYQKARERRARNEREASVALKSLTTAEAQLPSSPSPDRFWVGDVSGLYRLLGKSAPRIPIRLIGSSVAEADASPIASQELAPHSVPSPIPYSGYLFIALAKYEGEGTILAYDQGSHWNREGFGFCAYPADYPRSGRKTFITSEGNEVWEQDTGGKPPAFFPYQPGQSGWTRPD